MMKPTNNDNNPAKWKEPQQNVDYPSRHFCQRHFRTLLLHRPLPRLPRRDCCTATACWIGWSHCCSHACWTRCHGSQGWGKKQLSVGKKQQKPSESHRKLRFLSTSATSFQPTEGAPGLSLDPSCGRHQPLQVHDGASGIADEGVGDGRYLLPWRWLMCFDLKNQLSMTHKSQKHLKTHQ